MKTLLSILCGCFLSANVFAQVAYEVTYVDDFASAEPCIALAINAHGVFIETESVPFGLITDGCDFEPMYLTKFAQKKDNWTDFGPLSERKFGDYNPAALTFDDGDSIYIMAMRTPSEFGNPKSLVEGRFNKSSQVYENLGSILKATDTLIPLHASLSSDGNQLIFSALMTGGKGGYDLYFMNRIEGGWSQIYAFGDEINTSGNEVFPQWYKGDVFFSSNGPGGKGDYDLFKTSKESQWKEIELLPEGLNSALDDMNLLWITSEKALLTSNRGGYLGVYLAEERKEVELLVGYSAILECQGTPVQNATIVIKNQENDVVFRDSTNSEGTFLLETLEMKTSYRVDFTGADEQVLSKSLLYIVNPSGERIMVFAPGRGGFFNFEILPADEIKELTLMDEIDDSRLFSVKIEGQVFEDEPGDVGKGEPIYIMDVDGNLMALAYTTDKGRFKFDELSPNATYSFQLDENKTMLNMVIIDNGDRIEVLLEGGRGVYERISDKEGITLINEKDESILIRRDELFVIQQIYYELNSSVLNVVAMYQLTQLAKIMVKNPSIRIELGSHTDSRGKDDYNLRLSEARAIAALSFLESNGVPSNRMIGKGFGEGVLLNGCDDDVPCEEEDHALNRRTEIKVVIQ
jgi:outer membrane protein OmpA-like peptidoglycan-associated protein